MDVVIFGATGMVGQGVLRECIVDPEIRRIVSIGRTPLGPVDPKVHDAVAPDLFDLGAVEEHLTGLDACFFCLGVSSVGMAEDAYTRVTYDLTMSIAGRLARLQPQMTFIYVSGAGTDSTESGRSMWARVKGRTENSLLRMFKSAYMFRPAYIHPLHGIRSKTRIYQLFIRMAAPLLPLVKRFPRFMTTTESVGRAMIEVAKRGAPSRILESADINRIAE